MWRTKPVIFTQSRLDKEQANNNQSSYYKIIVIAGREYTSKRHLWSEKDNKPVEVKQCTRQ